MMWKLALLALVACTHAAPVADTFDYVKPLRAVGTKPSRAYEAMYMLAGKREWVKMECPKNTVFDDDMQVCVHAALTGDVCTTDKTVKAEGFHADAKSCNAFYQCVHGKSQRNCCPAGLGWNATINACAYTGCTKRPDCVVPQLVDTNVTTTQGPAPATCVVGNYEYEVDSKKANGYIQTDVKNATLTYNMECPNNRPFSTRMCGCDPSGDAVKANEDELCLKLDFNNKENFGTTKDYCEATNVKNVNEQACFKGDGKLEFPLFNNMDIGDKLTVAMTFTGKTGLLLNNGGKCGAASVTIAVTGGKVKATLVTSKSQYSTEVDVDGDSLVLTYNGKEMKLVVGKNEKAVAAEGNIKRVHCDLSLGSKYTGCMDNVAICKYAK